MRRTPITLALVFAGALSFAAVSSAQSTTSGQSGTDPQSGSSAQSGTSGSDVGNSGQTTGSTASTSSYQHDNRSKDEKYFKKIAAGNMAEIQLSQLAVQRAQDPQVKQFAQTMVDQHTEAQNQLQQVASGSGFSLPSELDSKHQKLHNKLSGLSGQEFDREYMKQMVNGHEDMTDLLKKASRSNAQSARSTSSTSGTDVTGTSGTATGTTSTTGTSGSTGTSGQTSGMSGTAGTTNMSGAADLTGFASTMLPNVEQHLQHAKDLEKQLKQNDKGGK